MEKEETDLPSTAPTQTATKPTKSIPSEPPTPKMDDTRVVDGQKQVYFLGFGWIENNYEPNECIYLEDIYENGNKIGMMGGVITGESNGDINRTLSEQYISEQKTLRETISHSEERMENLKNSLTNVDRFIEKAKKYTDLTELTPEILHMFIDRIEVGEKAEKYSRTAPQNIWIHYRDIGMLNDVKKEFDIESPEETFQEI